jgi:hypothetical protein
LNSPEGENIMFKYLHSPLIRKPALRLVVLFISLVFLFSALLSASYAQVDLRGKKGVVNPADLKKSDPKPPSLKIKEPPAPKPQPSQHKEVHQEKQHRHGSDEQPPRGGAAVPARPPLYVPPPRPVGR